MSATFYELMKYARTGIANADMAGYDKLKARAMIGGGYALTTITGVPPIRFKAKGDSLTAWSITGNSVPSLNLYDKDRTDGVTDGYFINKRSRQEQALYTYEISYPIAVTVGQQYRWTFNAEDGVKHSNPTVGFYDDTDTMFSVATHPDEITSFTFTVPTGCTYIRASVYKATKGQAMLTAGDSEIPYIPYGDIKCGDLVTSGAHAGEYAIPITCGGATQTIYLDAPISTGDSVTMADTGVIITPESGVNTLSVGTTVQPSEVSITGKIKKYDIGYILKDSDGYILKDVNGYIITVKE